MTKPVGADDQPFDFNLDSFVKGLDLQPFRFHWKDRRWTLTHIDDLDSWVMAKVGEDGEAVLREAMGADQYTEFTAIPLPQGGLKKMLAEYYKHCGVDPGELQGSTSS